MVFKRYIKKGGKLYGPYYYKSFRDSKGIVRKKYIGISLPNKERLKKFFKGRNARKSLDKKYVTPLKSKGGRGLKGVGSAVSKWKKSVKEIQPKVKPVLSFLVVLFLVGLFLVFSIGVVVNSGKLVGRVVDGVEVSSVNVGSNSLSRFTGFVISPIVDESDELVKESYDKEVDLEIKDAPMLAGSPVSENKNERMVFDSSQGKIRLYFDLLNYSEFVETIAENEGLVDESIQTGYGSKNSGYGMTGNIIRFFGLVGRVVGITGDLSEGDTASLQNMSDVESENNIDNISQDNESILGGEDISAGEDSQLISEESSVKDNLENINLDKIKEAVSNLSSEELDVIAEGVKIKVEDNEFDIEVNESKALEKGVDYKWGYKVMLKDLKFMAKIDITSDEGITLLDNSSLRIGNKILSFKDLVDSGYDVRIDVPVLEIGNFSFSEDNVSEIIEIESNVTENVSIIEENITEEIEEINETGIIESNVTVEDVGGDVNKTKEKEEKEKKVKEEESKDEIKKNNDEKVKESKKDKQTGYGLEEQTGYGILGNVIRAITGFVVQALSPEVEDIKYANSVSVYVERDFSDLGDKKEKINPSEIIKSDSAVDIIEKSNVDYGDGNKLSESSQIASDLGDKKKGRKRYFMMPGIDFEDIDLDGKVSIGDIIFLDPSLIIIKITKAEHLDENRTFIKDIYNETKEKDDIWSEAIGNGEYVRVTFEQNLTKDKDITVYARAVDNCETGENLVIINGIEVSCDIYEKKRRIDEIRRVLNQS